MSELLIDYRMLEIPWVNEPNKALSQWVKNKDLIVQNDLSPSAAPHQLQNLSACLSSFNKTEQKSVSASLGGNCIKL